MVEEQDMKPGGISLEDLRDLIDREENKIQYVKRHHRQKLNGRTPEEWSELIRKIPDKDVRTRAACIVAWDYGYKGTAEWSQYFDQWVETRQKNLPASDDLADALHHLGYLRSMIVRRIYDTPTEGEEKDQIHG